MHTQLCSRQDHLTRCEKLREKCFEELDDADDDDDAPSALKIHATIIRLHTAIVDRNTQLIREIVNNSPVSLLYATNHIGYNAVEYAIKLMNYTAYSIMNLKIKKTMEGKLNA